MKIELGGYYVTGPLGDLEELPESPDEFFVDLSFDVCPTDGTGSLGQFDVRVCTPKWLDNYMSDDSMLLGRHLFIVKRWDPERVIEYIRHFVESIEADTWEELAELISRIAAWEGELDPYMDWEKY